MPPEKLSRVIYVPFVPAVFVVENVSQGGKTVVYFRRMLKLALAALPPQTKTNPVFAFVSGEFKSLTPQYNCVSSNFYCIWRRAKQHREPRDYSLIHLFLKVFWIIGFLPLAKRLFRFVS
jgi:hypothetical protein